MTCDGVLRERRAAGEPARAGLGWRLITATFGIPVVLGVIYVGGLVFMAVVGVALVTGYAEFARALKLRGAGLIAVGVATVAGLVVSARFADDGQAAVLAIGAAASLVTLIVAGEVPTRLDGWGLALAGVLYVGLLGQYLVLLRELPNGRDWLLLAIFTTFATDTGAYATGRLVGRHKLAPRLSPSKTVEGALGGLLAGAAGAVALGELLDLGEPAAATLALGGAAAVAGQLGDLAESLIKRSAGVKDMSSVLPGHGGVLDRLDSLLFVVPLVYFAARWWLA